MSIPTQRPTSLPELVDSLNAAAERVQSEKRCTESEFVWFSRGGDTLGSGRLMTVQEAGWEADDRFNAVTIGGDGAITVKVWNATRKYWPTTPNRPALLWFRDGDMTGIGGDGQLADDDGAWFTKAQAVERLRTFIGVREAYGHPFKNEIRTVSMTGGETVWVGTPITPGDVTLDHVEALRKRDFRTMDDGQWEALLAFMTAIADGVGGRAEENAKDTFFVRMMAPVVNR